MDTVHQVLRLLHIAAGMTAFFVAPVALAARKGGKVHAFWGSLFFRVMLLVAASALLMAFIMPNPFLSLVAVFSFHLSLSGYRAVARRRATNQALAMKTDFAIATVMLLFYSFTWADRLGRPFIYATAVPPVWLHLLGICCHWVSLLDNRTVIPPETIE
jgi:uncharacterized membrane protein